MIYLDANVFIYAILRSGKDKIGEKSASLLFKIADNKVEAATSFLTWDEVLWSIKKYLGYKIALSESRKFLVFPNLTFVQADRMVLHFAQNIAEKYALHPRDSIHAATAALNNIKTFVSDDEDFDNVKGIKRVPPEKFNYT
jgi:predicted nucleic acid-binding protein